MNCLPIGRAASVVVALAFVADGASEAAAVRRPEPGAPALAGGARAVGADEVARVARRIGDTPSTTVYVARLPDGTLELSDRPPPAGAATVVSRSYALPPDDAARRRAEVERLHWLAQAEAFAQRRRELARHEAWLKAWATPPGAL